MWHFVAFILLSCQAGLVASSCAAEVGIFQNIPIYSNGDQQGLQGHCNWDSNGFMAIEFVARWVYAKWGIQPVVVRKWWASANPCNSSLFRHRSSPAIGDIAIIGKSSPFHVGIVRGIGSDGFEMAEQNLSPDGVGSYGFADAKCFFSFHNRSISSTISTDYVNVDDVFDLMHFHPIVDATVSQMRSVYHTGNLYPFTQNVVRKVKAGAQIEVLVVGGSMTYGAELEDHLGDRWSTTLTSILNSNWTKAYFHVRNVAVGGMGIDIWVSLFHELIGADLVIVDLSVNDFHLLPDAIYQLYDTYIKLLDSLPTPPALLFNLGFRLEKVTKAPAGACQHVGIICKGDWLFADFWWKNHDVVASVLNKYSIPYVSYRDLVWPVFDKPSDDLPLFWNGSVHPDIHAHSLVGKLIAYSVFTMLKEVNAKEYNPAGYVGNKSETAALAHLFCTSPLSNMMANDSHASVAHFHTLQLPTTETHNGEEAIHRTGNWSFYADRGQKYGWILIIPTGFNALADHAVHENANPYVLSFSVTFGADDPRLAVYYLKSYAHFMGDVQMWLDSDRKSTVILTGSWLYAASLTQYAVFLQNNASTVNNGGLKEVHHWPSITPGQHALHFAPVRPDPKKEFKFKILGIRTC